MAAVPEERPLSLSARLFMAALPLALLVLVDLGLRISGINGVWRANKPTPLAMEDPDVMFRLRQNLEHTTQPSKPITLNPELVLPELSPFTVRTNGQGLRHDRLVTKRAPATGFRLITIGDSYTFGYGVDLEDTFAKQVERALRREHPEHPIEVVNAGQPGHSSVQGAAFYDQHLADIEAQAITVCYAANDYGISVLGYHTARRRFERGTNLLQRLRSVFLRSEIFVLFLRARERLHQRIRESKPYQFPDPKVLLGSPEDCSASIVRIVEAARARGVEHAFVMTQARVPGAVHEPTYREAARRAAELSGAVLVDAAAAMDRAMASHPEPPGGWSQTPHRFFVDPTHLSPEGNRVVADALLAAMAEASVPSWD